MRDNEKAMAVFIREEVGEEMSIQVVECSHHLIGVAKSSSILAPCYLNSVS